MRCLPFLFLAASLPAFAAPKATTKIELYDIVSFELPGVWEVQVLPEGPEEKSKIRHAMAIPEDKLRSMSFAALEMKELEPEEKDFDYIVWATTEPVMTKFRKSGIEMVEPVTKPLVPGNEDRLLFQGFGKVQPNAAILSGVVIRTRKRIYTIQTQGLMVLSPEAWRKVAKSFVELDAKKGK